VALSLEDKVKQAKMLATLIPHLPNEQSSEALAQGLHATLAIRDEWDRVKMLAEFLPLVSDQTEILLYIRQKTIDFLLSIYTWSRQQVLISIFSTKLFTPPIFSSQTLDAIASSLIEICQDWHWM
jgi:hypothetical protein